MARKPKKEEHINHERWLVSYADFITLLFAFFTSLYAISTVDAKKAGKMVFSTRAAFNVDFFPSDKPILGLSSQEVQDVTTVKVNKEHIVNDVKRKHGINTALEGVNVKTLRDTMSEITKIIDIKKMQGVTVTSSRYGMVVSLRDAAFFEPASVEIRKSSLPALDMIAEKLLKTHLDIRVEGHTDGSLVAGSRYRSNWELSTARAATVVNYFIEQFGYPPEALSVAGYASNKPSNDNHSAMGRASNRRVDIVLLTPHRDVPSTIVPSGAQQPNESPMANPATGAPTPGVPAPATGPNGEPMPAPMSNQGPGLPIKMP